MIGRCALLFLVGTALQFMWGNVDASFLIYPWNLCVAVNYLYLHILMYSYAGKYPWVKTLYDRPATLSSLFSLLILTLVFGLVRQDGSTDSILGMLGFTRMSSSWIFVLYLLHFLTALGMKVIDDMVHWRIRNLPVVLMHVACYVVMLSSVLSSGEKVRVRVTAAENASISMGITENRKMYELPFTLTLKEFSMEGDSLRMYYLSKVAITDEEGTQEANILVNHPASIGAWRIYQAGYDQVQGRWISIFECVKDGWYPLIQVAMWVILIGGVWMMSGGWNQRKRKKEDKA